MEKQYAQNPAIENILTCRSVRSYTDQDVEPEKLEAILEAGMAAPSGKNGQPWDFIVLTRREILDEMAERLPYAKMLREARVAIAVCADRTKSPYWYVDCSAAAENILLAAHALGLGAVDGYVSISRPDGCGQGVVRAAGQLRFAVRDPGGVSCAGGSPEGQFRCGQDPPRGLLKKKGSGAWFSFERKSVSLPSLRK